MRARRRIESAGKVVEISLILLVIAITSMRLLGFNFLIIGSDSMEPTIPKGALAITVPAKFYDNFTVGDIITYKFQKGNTTYYITHRIVDHSREDDECYTTKGDNRKYVDPWPVCPVDIVGKVVLSIPHLGSALLTFARVYLVIFPFLIATTWYIITKEIVEDIARMHRMKVSAAKRRMIGQMIRRSKVVYYKRGRGL